MSDPTPADPNPIHSPEKEVTREYLLDWDTEQLAQWLVAKGFPKFRASQIQKWVFQRRASRFDQMTDLPKDLRLLLDQNFDLFRTSTAAHQQAADGTEKLLLQLADGGRIECVLLRDGPRRSICVSSQVGCAMGCVFCASGLDGVERNLTRGEILEQMLKLQHLLEVDERLSHIVMMGMGEPLANLPRVLSALSVAKDSTIGLGISPRRITISTVGLPPAIDKLAAADAPYHLAISLHAPNDPLRNRLVPVNQTIGIESILDAADRYFEKTKRRLTFEYVLLGGLNDSVQCARELVQLLRRRTAMLNVIPYNPVPGLPYETPTPSAVLQFRRTLLDGGINAMFRQRKGDEIQAACGQLRRLRERQPQVVSIQPSKSS
ncbi:MAG: 23S rRNA (adenine(2503)-C(2))-methyltransferase RlmN [Planctomycetota bacterium]|jgi:23S rRNA (adenine2503-C2)-methyltransferase